MLGQGCCFCCCYECRVDSLAPFSPRSAVMGGRKYLKSPAGASLCVVLKERTSSCRMDTITITGKRSVFSPLFIFNRTTEDRAEQSRDLASQPAKGSVCDLHGPVIEYTSHTHTHTHAYTPTTTPGLFIYKQMFQVLFLFLLSEKKINFFFFVTSFLVLLFLQWSTSFMGRL